MSKMMLVLGLGLMPDNVNSHIHKPWLCQLAVQWVKE
jgi:hypothetical protein